MSNFYNNLLLFNRIDMNLTLQDEYYTLQGEQNIKEK